MTNLKLTEINIYPVKSLGGISLNNAQVTTRGLEHDRRWMIVDQNNQFITQRTHRKMALIKTALSDSKLNLTFGSENISIPLQKVYGDFITVHVWQSTCQAQLVDPEIDLWLTAIMGFPVKLVYMPDSTERQVNPTFAIDRDIVSFADAYPILLVSEESLKNLNSKLDQSLPMNRFRPNFVFSGGYPHIEDDILQYSIGDCRFQNVKPCDRCVVTTIDQKTIERSKEPLKTLASYRMANHNVYFGMNSIPLSVGSVKLGDQITVISEVETKVIYSG